MDSLRVDNGIRKIEVNDNGDCIEFSVSDGGFFKGFSELLQWFDDQKTQQEIKEAEEQGNEVVSYDGKEINYETLRNVVIIRENLSKEVCKKIDNIFGDFASEKIFGKIIPDMFSIAEFFEKISPFIEKYAKERNQTISKKYNKNRKGAKS
ncbi:hypothetical protein C805_00083 [Eubacterium sp. 14-2]|uniref:hypothetical protein n=1 Tax=Eubacterium sp. 14-2 TaxID=1235790 RepID=UPI00033D6425|nr:hypothetical protein [Eubacterium sp. 14-2]EOT29499.1 hypothetical protein C805_00083 [Eubacterium sp. 14-2]